MGRLAGFRYRDIIKRLKRLGFAFDRQAAGSHEIWFNPDTGRYTTIPNHPGDMSEGTLRAILRQAGITAEEFFRKVNNVVHPFPTRSTLLRYVSGAAPQLDAENLHAAVVECITQGDTIMPTIAERWVDQGVQQGQAALLRRLLTRRFGSLPEWAEARLTHAELAQLETWADRVLDADTLDAVFR